MNLLRRFQWNEFGESNTNNVTSMVSFLRIKHEMAEIIWISVPIKISEYVSWKSLQNQAYAFSPFYEQTNIQNHH